MMFRFIFAFALVLFLSTHYAFTHQSKTTYFQRIEFLFVESFRPNVQAASTTLTGIHSAAADPVRPATWRTDPALNRLRAPSSLLATHRGLLVDICRTVRNMLTRDYIVRYLVHEINRRQDA